MSPEHERRPVSLCPMGHLRLLLRDLEGKRVTLMGLGTFGGGLGAARFLIERGARLTVTDLKNEQELSPSLARLPAGDITCHLGGHVETDFTDTDLVVASPAVPRNSGMLLAAQAAGVPITSPMNMFLALCPAPVCAVTGTNGKSTTASLLEAILRRSGRRAWLGGNIGRSLLPELARIGPRDVVVLELSSFQLEDARPLGWSPHVAVITNITPDHLDRHGSFEDYAEAKRTILRNQKPQDFAILNARDRLLSRWAEEGLGSTVLFFDAAPDPSRTRHGMALAADRFVWENSRRTEVVCLRDDLPLPGLHNAENAMAAAAAAFCLGAASHDVRDAFHGFVGLEHRIEPVGRFHGMRVYNDSYSTTPEAAIAAIKSFDGPITLIAGGYDKKLDLTALSRAAASAVEVLVAFGQTGPTLARHARREGLYLGRSLTVEEVDSLEQAVRAADRLSMPGSTILFSPGCASYDQFSNYAARGRAFKELVRALLRD